MSDEKLIPIPKRPGISWEFGTQGDKERTEFERQVSEMFTVKDCSFKRYGNFGPYLHMVTSKNYPSQPSGGEFICTQSLWNVWQASAERYQSRIAELEARLKIADSIAAWSEAILHFKDWAGCCEAIGELNNALDLWRSERMKD